MNDNILNTVDLFNNDFKFKEKFIDIVPLDTLISFWISNYNFKKEYEKCKIKDYQYGFNFKENQILISMSLYEKVENNDF